MGVPALFRWLSKKYPKIVEQVIEDVPVRREVEGGYEEAPIDMSRKNPNGIEFDNLYLDMNGIVHPCTHPEGKKPPETEEEMMIEVFKYTERVVNMVRPRKLLMIAIDGVAPRAKMNQQRSRRFRAAQEAKTKEEEKQMAIEEWKLKGKELSEEYKTNKKAWDSNAITPGTPFMTLLTESLRYWIVHKMNTDEGWKRIQVILSDASVPGEGEHKIMDFIRRQRTQPTYDPNTRHVIYGLDADLIMLSLATHEPHFKVLREDVFADQKKGGRGCHTCGQLGHHSSQCQGKPKEKIDEFDIKQKPVERKPFIFLDVSTLREYLAVELNLGGLGFPFDLERAIDDWVLLIFFVGNDFLPHLPSLEIREGAIDTLLKIWKANLAQMGGYLTDCGKLHLKRTELILEGLAAREDEIFKRRREAEERQDRETKKRKIDSDNANRNQSSSGSYSSCAQIEPAWTSSRMPQGLPSRPAFLPPRPTGNNPASGSIPGLCLSGSPTATVSMMSNADIVRNRFAIRSANLDAAAMLKAELSGVLNLPAPVPAQACPPSQPGSPTNADASESNTKQETFSAPKANRLSFSSATAVRAGGAPTQSVSSKSPATALPERALEDDEGDADAEGEVDNEATDAKSVDLQTGPAAGDENDQPQVETRKRKAENPEADSSAVLQSQEEQVVVLSDDDDDEAAGNVSVFVHGQPSKPGPLKMVGNNMAEQEDTVKLWEPGYRERYFRQKFGLELSDETERRRIVKHYVEGLAWVLAYYYQGCQSWQWFYPYHYSPFAADFTRLDELHIEFNLGQPFRPYEQLMGVFPSASRSHIPTPYHELMVSDDSPIKDFYPEEFEIDMNGKKMIWQGVALLPFIEQDRLLDSMKPLEDKLSLEDKSRNEPGDVVIFCSEMHSQYDNLCKMYRKRDATEPVALDPAAANGVFGSALPDHNCIPGSTFHSPLPSIGLPDISNDKSIFARFFFPSQLIPHRSTLLKGVRVEKRILNNNDRDVTRRGGNPSTTGSGNSYGDGFHQQRRDIGDGPGIMTNYRSNQYNLGHANNMRNPYREPIGLQSQSTYNSSYGPTGLPQRPASSVYSHGGYLLNNPRGVYRPPPITPAITQLSRSRQPPNGKFNGGHR